MDKGSAKKYFKKINTTFEGVNRQDDFAKSFLSVLKGADTKLYHKERRERRVFEDSFMDAIEQILPVIDKLTRNPAENLKKHQEVVPVERAKKIDADTVRHLAANTQFIKDVDERGNVIPHKVLTSYQEVDLGTYENRFIMSLVNKLYLFIELRYDVIVEKAKTEYINYLKIDSTLEWEDSTIDYDITFRVHQDSSQDEIGRRNVELLKRMTDLRHLITNYKMSKFMKDMGEFPPVRPPIMKTNKILKNYDYRSCYDMWTLLDETDRIGYDVDVFERDIEFEDKYLGEVENALMVLYATVANNQIEDFELSFDMPFDYHKRKTPKVLKQYVNDKYIDPGEFIFQDNTMNQYFLDQIRKANEGRLKTLISAGIREDEAVKMIYQRLSSIADAAFVNFINENFKPEEEKDVNDRIEIQKKILKAYRSIDEIQKNNIANMQTQKALSQLSLNNYEEELRKEIEESKLRKELDQAEKLRDLMEEKRDEVDKEINKKKKLQKAKDILDDAEKERREKKIRELREFY
jgi:hypothetical protein